MAKLRSAAALAAGVALLLPLAACGTSTSTSPQSSGPVTLTLWTGFTGGDRPGYAQIVKDFEQSHPNIKIDMTVYSWDTILQKLPSAWMTGSGPDLATQSSDPNAVAQYVKTNEVLPITNIGDGDNQVNADKFAAGLTKEFTYDNKLYAVPANFATLSLYYNKDMFKAAGLQPPTTVKQLQEDAVKLTKSDGSQYGLSLADNVTIQMWPILQWLEGGDIVNSKNCSTLQTAAGQKSLKTWADLVVKDKISPVGQTGAQADTLFQSGKAAMELNGPWAAPTFKAAKVNFGVIPVPAAADGTHVTLASTAPLSISAKTKYPKQAQEFLAYWTGKAAQKQFSLTTGFPPMRTDLVDDAQLKANPTISVFQSQAKIGRLYLPQVPNATQVDAAYEPQLIGQITRGTAVAQATQAAAQAIDGLTGCKA